MSAFGRDRDTLGFTTLSACVYGCVFGKIWEIFEAVCEAREWTRDEAVETLSRNWARFTRPNEERRRAFDEDMGGRAPNKSNRQRKRERRQVDLYVSDDDDDESERTGLGSVVKE